MGSWSLLWKGGGIKVCNENKGEERMPHFLPLHARPCTAFSYRHWRLITTLHKSASTIQFLKTPTHTGCTDFKIGSHLLKSRLKTSKEITPSTLVNIGKRSTGKNQEDKDLENLEKGKDLRTQEKKNFFNNNLKRNLRKSYVAKQIRKKDYAFFQDRNL